MLYHNFQIVSNVMDREQYLPSDGSRRSNLFESSLKMQENGVCFMLYTVWTCSNLIRSKSLSKDPGSATVTISFSFIRMSEDNIMHGSNAIAFRSYLNDLAKTTISCKVWCSAVRRHYIEYYLHSTLPKRVYFSAMKSVFYMIPVVRNIQVIQPWCCLISISNPKYIGPDIKCLSFPLFLQEGERMHLSSVSLLSRMMTLVMTMVCAISKKSQCLEVPMV